eukprot:g3730.t1
MSSPSAHSKHLNLSQRHQLTAAALVTPYISCKLSLSALGINFYSVERIIELIFELILELIIEVGKVCQRAINAAESAIFQKRAKISLIFWTLNFEI